MGISAIFNSYISIFSQLHSSSKNYSLYNELFWIENSEKLQKKNRRKETKKKCYNALIWVWSFVYVTHCFLFLQKRVHVICFKSSSHKVTSVIYCFPKFLRVRPDQVKMNSAGIMSSDIPVFPKLWVYLNKQ